MENENKENSAAEEMSRDEELKNEKSEETEETNDTRDVKEKEQKKEESKKEEPSPPPEKSKEEELEEKVHELENKYLRLYAEFDNFKKRSAKEKDARYGDAVIDTAAVILDVADNLERALKTEVESDDAKKLYEGIAMVDKQMKDAFAKLDIKEIKALGEQFDPNLHNAVMHIEDETIDDNTIVEEFMKGYIYKGSRVVRHSMVKVAN